jgi:flagellar biogenesis protein FliO
MRRSNRLTPCALSVVAFAGVALVAALRARADESAATGAAGLDPWAALRIFEHGAADHQVEPQAAPDAHAQHTPANPPPSLSAAEEAAAAGIQPAPPPVETPAVPAPRPVLRRPEPGAMTTATGPMRGDSGWLRTFGSLAGVVLLILLLGWGYRVVAGGSRMSLARSRRPELLQVLARTAVSARQSLCLVRVGPRIVLVGVAPDRLTALDVITDPATAAQLAGRAAQGDIQSHTADFEHCLDREARAYDAAPAASGEAGVADDSQVGAIRRTLQAAAARLRQSAR